MATHPQTDSSASDSSVGLNRQRQRDDPASGRGKTKRTMMALTTDSDSGSDVPRVTYDGYRHNRQVSPRFFHAPDPDGGTEPPFPPRIARNRVERRAPPPRPLTNHTPALVPHARRESTPVNEDLSPVPTQLLIETITNATLAAVNQHLMSAGLLPRPTVDLQPTELSLTRPAPPPSTLVQTTAPTPAPTNVQYLNHDARYTQNDGSPHSANTASPTALWVHSQNAGRIPHARHTPRSANPALEFFASHERTAATQLLVHSMRDALSCIFDVADPSGSVTMRSPTWVSGWHAPLLKLTKASIIANRDNTHILHRLINDLFAQVQERLASGVDGPAAFGTLLTDVADYFDRAPRRVALATLKQFGVPSGTPISSFLRSFRVVVTSTVDKGGPLAPSPEMTMKLICIRTAQQYPMLMPTLFPGVLATRERPYDSLATLCTVFAT